MNQLCTQAVNTDVLLAVKRTYVSTLFGCMTLSSNTKQIRCWNGEIIQVTAKGNLWKVGLRALPMGQSEETEEPQNH